MKKLFLILNITFCLSKLFAQGCSDAGICSVGAVTSLSKNNDKNAIEFASIYGIGLADVTYISPYISYTRKFSDKFSLNSRVTFSSAHGSFGTKSSFGDAFLIGSYSFKEKKNKQWSILSGFKFPLNGSNLKINGFSLPLDYQSSLGTFDLFLGANFNYKKWDFNSVLQVPVFNINKNSYFDEFSASNDFPTTNLFKRKSDILFRTTYTIKTKSKKFTFKPNILFIYHLGEDTYENIFGIEKSIKNSDGLTINGNLITSYSFNKNSSLDLSLATPFLVREIRPDGLTRSFVGSIIYKINF